MRQRPLKYSRNSREAVLAYVKEFVSQYHYAPSIRQIGAAVGLSSSSTVHQHLRTLEREGQLTREVSKPRSIKLTWPKKADEVVALRAAMRAALDNPESWRETLEQALQPTPAGELAEREAA